MNNALANVIIGVAALGVGGAGGYFIGKRVANKKADARINEITEYWQARINEAEGPAAIITSGEAITTQKDEASEFFKAAIDDMVLESRPMYPNPAEELETEEEIQEDFPEAKTEYAEDFTVEGLAPAVDARAFIEQFKNRSTGEFGGVSIIENKNDDIPEKTVPDFVSVRDPQGPYVISIDEFMDPESDPPFTKVELRWFRGDNIVVDSRDDRVPIETVGQKNTERFGEGTTDPNQVYIRNERLSIDIELTLETGMYLHEVLGQDFPDKSPILKMRERDDG